jgi:hypothetical protein
LVIKIKVEKLNITAAAVYVGLGINQRRCKNEITTYVAIVKIFLERYASSPIRNQLNKIADKIIIVNQLTLGSNSYKFETSLVFLFPPIIRSLRNYTTWIILFKTYPIMSLD